MGARASREGEESVWGSGEERGSLVQFLHGGDCRAEGNTGERGVR
jgi:hypothetical protein